jgi:hypothetical protein
MKCFLNYLEILTSSIYPNTVVLEIFPGSFGNVSCIKNVFGTVYCTVYEMFQDYLKLILRFGYIPIAVHKFSVIKQGNGSFYTLNLLKKKKK